MSKYTITNKIVEHVSIYARFLWPLLSNYNTPIHCIVNTGILNTGIFWILYTVLYTHTHTHTHTHLVTWCEELIHWKRPWCWERLRAGKEKDTENEMVGWHHQLNGHDFEQTPGDTEGQGRLACCSPLGRKESDMT